MNDTNLQDLEQVDQFLTGTAAVNFKASSRIESYRWIAKTLKRFDLPPINWTTLN